MQVYYFTMRVFTRPSQTFDHNRRVIQLRWGIVNTFLPENKFGNNE